MFENSYIYALIRIEHFIDFHDEYSKIHSISNQQEILIMIDCFKEYLKERFLLTDRENTIISMTKENIYKSSNAKMSLAIESLKVPEEFIEQFKKDFENCAAAEAFGEPLAHQRYKTKKEIQYTRELDFHKLLLVYDKYRDFNHPYICARISLPILDSNLYSIGIRVLEPTLRISFRYPNIYWHNLNGVLGCMYSLMTLQELLKDEGLNEINRIFAGFRLKILKLIYLYLSRCINISDNKIITADSYRNRARFVETYRTDFIGLFELTANPEIMVMTDYLLAFNASGIEFRHLYKQCYWNATIIYRYSQGDGGYRHSDERTLSSMTKSAELKSQLFAKIWLSEFEKGELNLKNSEIESIMGYITARHRCS